jgi:L-2-hydroxyglutarate oxidase LhgO
VEEGAEAAEAAKAAEAVDAVVVGAGVVGLAVARALARAGREVLILEALDAWGTQTSARNSEVLHAGLYYPKHWLKTRLCIEGRPMLERFADAHGVDRKRVGKLVVAIGDDDMPKLHALHANATANGATVEWIDGAAARRMEPALASTVTGALWSPNTGIVDSHGLMRALLGDAEAAGAMLALQSPVRAIVPCDAGIDVEVASDPPMRLRARIVVDAAGHGAPTLARASNPAHAWPRAHRSKGNYFALEGKAPFSRLIYPMASADALGVHLTLDLGGQARFGPDAQWLREGEPDDHTVDTSRREAFETSVRRFWPTLPEGSLQPAFAGLRPKIHAPHEPLADFAVFGPAEHGTAGLVHLLGIESPGLTSSLALAREVLHRLGIEPTVQD